MSVDASTLITEAQAVAKELATRAASMVDNAAKSFDTRYEIGQATYPLKLDNINLTLAPVVQYSGERFHAPPAPGAAPTNLPLPPVYTAAAPSNRAERPSFESPSAPSELAQFSGVAPTLSGISIPSAPDALSHLDITPPTLTTIVVPDAPSVVIPTFDVVRPDTDIAAPGDFTGQFRADFSEHGAVLRGALDSAVDAYMAKINPRFAEQMSAIETRLSKYLAGGSGLAPEVEDAIYARAAGKTNDEYLRVRDTAYAEGARRGFTMPAGSVFSAVMQARQGAADNNARAAMEIAIKQAELEQQNLQFAVTQSTNLRQMVIAAAQQWASNLVQINAQALQFANGVLQATVELYGIKVKIVQAKVEVYRAEAQVYEYRLKAVLAVYDAYQAHIKGLEAQVNVDVAKVQAFTAQANSYGALANAYKAVIEGVATKAQIEKLKVDAFGAEVQAYAARVGGKTAEWQGYKARVEGEVSKFEVYKAEVQAYAMELEAHKTNIESHAKNVEATATANESQMRSFAASVSAYTAQVQGQSAAVMAEINSYEATIKQWTANANAQEAQARVRLANVSAQNQTVIAAYGMNSQTAIANAQMNYKHMNDMAQVAISGAKVYEGMASSALAGMNSLAATVETKSL